MIHFSLKCAASHEFEGWFRDGDTFESQAAAGEITCPHCGGTGVEKAIMAPRVARSSKPHSSQPGPKPEPPADPAKLKQALRELRKQIETKFDYVGDRFADEARKIHQGEVDPRGIYGEATPDEARALAEDGIEFGRIPWIPPNDA